MIKIILLLFLTLPSIAADKNYAFRIAYGKATLSDFSEIIVGNWQGHSHDLRVFAMDASYLLQDNLFEKPLSVSIRTSLSYYDENRVQDNIYEGTLYAKFFYTFLAKKMRFGFGEGISYTSDILFTERLEALQENDNNSKFLNYIDLSLDINIAKVFYEGSEENIYVGWALKHRSGIFGLINNVSRGGSNYNTFYVEVDF